MAFRKISIWAETRQVIRLQQDELGEPERLKIASIFLQLWPYL